MHIHSVTITGADDHTAPEDLFAIAAEYPFVEWGILLSAQSWPRFPSLAWIERLAHLAPANLRCALHLCGRPLKDLCQGEHVAELERNLFQRVQLNLSQFALKAIDLPKLAAALPHGKEIIVQIGTKTTIGVTIATELQAQGHQVALLFDRSGGRGLVPEQWPELIDGFRCGFAGGLNPINLSAQLNALSNRVGETPIWIDMESGVRTEEDTLDLSKARTCLTLLANRNLFIQF